jgi:HAD-superfamily hydrolase, subfamily IIB
MNYKLVCIDMDGTLLNKQHKVSEVTRKALIKAHEMGVNIVISTGRMYTDAEGYSNLIGLKSPIIASNGAVVKEKGMKEVIYKSVLGEKLSLQLLATFSRHNIKPMYYTPERAYCGSILFKAFTEYAKLKRIMNRSVKVEYVRSNSLWYSILKKEKDNIVKCEVMDKSIEKLGKVREELQKISEIEVVSSSMHNIEITCRGVSKGTAVQALAAYYNINREEIITIGDSENDLSMIEYAGMGIAMGNAIDKAKQIADYVTDTNDNNGVAKAINRFIILKESKENKVYL